MFKAIFTSGMGFFTDAYDLFIIGTASTLISKQWHLDSSQTGLINSHDPPRGGRGSHRLGRIADRIGRKKIYGLKAGIMVVAALASAFSPNVVCLIVGCLVLGVGVGGDYPVSAVIMTEYANRKHRGKLVGLVFAMQALGTITGYVAGLTLLSSGVPNDSVWRILLALGAVPTTMVLYSRRRMPESPRYLIMVEGREAEAAAGMTEYSDGTWRAASRRGPARLTFAQFISNRSYFLTLIGTAGTWFVFDYA